MKFYFDDQPINAAEDDTVSTALWSAGIRELRASARRGEPRGMLCGMGVCQECVVWIDGRRVESCMTRVRSEMRVFGKAK